MSGFGIYLNKTKTVTKGVLFRLTVEVDSDTLVAMGKVPELAAKAMQAGADYWHTKVLPWHFEPFAHGKYGYASRGKPDRRKVGKPDLVFTGKMQQDLLLRAAFSIVGQAVVLRMQARTLNFVPAMPENSDAVTVVRSNGRPYPNMKREIKAMTDSDRKAVGAVVQNKFRELFNTRIALGE